MAAGAGGVRAEAVPEQIQLQLDGQLQTGDHRQNTLHAVIDSYQIVHIGVVQLGGFLDFPVLGLQNAGQGLLLFGNGLNQLGYRGTPLVLVPGRGLNGIHKATPHNCVSGSQRIFCTISAVSKTGNTYSIPSFLKL